MFRAHSCLENHCTLSYKTHRVFHKSPQFFQRLNTCEVCWRRGWGISGARQTYVRQVIERRMAGGSYGSKRSDSHWGLDYQGFDSYVDLNNLDLFFLVIVLRIVPWDSSPSKHYLGEHVLLETCCISCSNGICSCLKLGPCDSRCGHAIGDVVLQHVRGTC